MIEIKNLKKQYESVTPIECLNATIRKGDVISVIGPSGTGKSTLLRMINMLERPTFGQIIIDGEDITVPGYSLNKLREKVGMVFQSFNLFNNMTVIENVCFAPINIKGIKPKDAYERGMQLLDNIGLGAFALSYPDTLSGGQKQRVAIARSLAMDPEVILFDEPTSALDPTMVGEVQAVIKKLADEGHTMMLVTHDMAFAEKISNRVFFLNEGCLYEEGTPEQIFHNPQKEKTREFVLKLKNLHIRIDTPQYDYMSLYTSVELFALKNSMAGDVASKLKAVIEELCFGIAMPVLKEAFEKRSRLLIDVSYSDIDKHCVITAEWRHIKFDINDDRFAIQVSLIRHYSSSINWLSKESLEIII